MIAMIVLNIILLSALGIFCMLWYVTRYESNKKIEQKQWTIDALAKEKAQALRRIDDLQKELQETNTLRAQVNKLSDAVQEFHGKCKTIIDNPDFADFKNE